MNRVFCAALSMSFFAGACVSDNDDGQVGVADSGPNAADARGPVADAAPTATRMFVHTNKKLYLIDDLNFSLSEIGPFDAPDGDNMTDLAVTPDGEIYTLSSSALFRVDRETAKATKVADVSGTLNVGMTFRIDGTLLATDKNGAVRSINPQTGQVTELGEIGNGYAMAGDLVGVADGRMFAISDTGPMGNEDINNVLITIDPETGAFQESIGQIGFGRVFGSGVANGRIYAFTDEGYVIEINPSNGVGTERGYFPNVSFWGAGVTPRAAID